MAALLATNRDYYRRIADYYDVDAQNFEQRSRQNLVLQRLRDEFRRESSPYVRGRILEIGCGPGLDLVHWAQTCPEVHVVGLDISSEMQACAAGNIRTQQLSNARAMVGIVEDLPELFPGEQFDFVYCYFGALNTTRDLSNASHILSRLLMPEGAAVLTFVNRWYLLEMLYGVVRLRWRKAFARLRPVWNGYANQRSLESRCFSPGQIQNSFGRDFNIVARRGYCLLYPAWYRNPRWVQQWPKLSKALWRLDRWLNHTPLWSMGEYALYVLRPRRGPH